METMQQQKKILSQHMIALGEQYENNVLDRENWENEMKGGREDKRRKE